jgi:hypothetical protein
VRAPSGDLLIAHDYFGPGCPRNHEDEEHLTSVYRSADNGAKWANVTHIAGAFWSSLFVHEGAVCLLGASQQYGSIVVRRSTDSGNTWTHPKDEKCGLLFRGGPRREPPNYHCAPTPVLLKDGRICRAFENCDPCVWGAGFKSVVISADAGADLLDARSWRMSIPLPFDPGWLPVEWGKLKNPGFLEGNVVEAPDGALWNILRFHSVPVAHKAMMVRILDEGRRLEFDPASGFIDFPGGMTKFTIRRDSESGLYYTLCNDVPMSPAVEHIMWHWDMFPRNRLSLYASKDLRRWVRRRTVLEDDRPISPEESLRKTGFQYADWQFDGDDIIAAVRTAYDGAPCFHDANRITFHRIPDFRR